MSEGNVANWSLKPDWQRHFRAAGVNGSFLLYDLKNGRYHVFDRERAQRRFLPASTFKFFNSLVALETGVIPNEKQVLRWDGVDRGNPDWNQDQDLRRAFQRSTVWFYQELARRIGPERMRRYVRAANYGNGDIGGGIDRFWLDGALRISSEEQIRFLVRLHRNDLPFSPRAINLVKQIAVNAEHSGRGYVTRAKTGWVGYGSEPGNGASPAQIGWWVGYVVRRNGDAHFFALNIDMRKPADGAARFRVTKNILRDMNVID